MDKKFIRTISMILLLFLSHSCPLQIVIKHQQAVKEIGRLKEEHKKQLTKVNELAQKERIKVQSENEQNVGALTAQVSRMLWFMY